MEEPRVISVHEYQLRPGRDGQDLESAYQQAQTRGLFDIPGLIDHQLLHGLRGHRQGKYAAIWIYESIQAWEALWGEAGDPLPKDKYPPTWKIWEEEMLSPLLVQDPDEIHFTSYLILD